MADQSTDLERRWDEHNRQWRDPESVVAWTEAASDADQGLYEHRATAGFWRVLDQLGITLLVTREYEHLVLALSVLAGRPRLSYLRLPHPSGLVVDRERSLVHIACTRNPNQVVTLAPCEGLHERRETHLTRLDGRPLVPVGSRILPGSFYLHDLALINGELHANAVGFNAVVLLGDDERAELVWWPRTMESDGAPRTDRNYIQLNSIAPGTTLANSYFTASAERASARRPGHLNFPVDRRGVLFAGDTREPVAWGLTRPHSARLHSGEVWIDNSGYGELVVVRGGKVIVAHRLPGWTRGLCLQGDIAFVGTSRVIPRYQRYAPGLDAASARCGVHAINIVTGELLGSVYWPQGNQIFAIDWAPVTMMTGLPATVGRAGARRTRDVFYAFRHPRHTQRMSRQPG
ncbi:MAG: DUF4915 domain-containing protein [Chloroflexota bacterium]